MPKIAHYTLVWSPLHQAYELRVSAYSGIQDIVPESPAWLAWVSQISSFAFHGRNGSYTACKESKQRGEGYWYAYARIGGKLTKRYLGRGSSLTLPRLEQVAQELWLDTPETPLLATKLHVPRPRPHLVHRPRLFQLLWASASPRCSPTGWPHAPSRSPGSRSNHRTTNRYASSLTCLPPCRP